MNRGRQRTRSQEDKNRNGVVPPHIQKTRELSVDHASDGGGSVSRPEYRSGSRQEPPSYNTPAYTRNTSGTEFDDSGKISYYESYGGRNGKNKGYNNPTPPSYAQSDDNDGYSLDSFATGNSYSQSNNGGYDQHTGSKNPWRKTKKGLGKFLPGRGGNDNSAPPQNLEYDSSGSSRNHNNNDHQHNSYNTNASDTLNHSGAARSHASSYGGGSQEFDEFGIHDDNDDDDSDKEFYAEFSLMGGDGHIGDAPNYGQASRHKKDLASQNLHNIEKMTQKAGANPIDETFRVMPDYAYKDVGMTRRQLREETNAKSAYYHDQRLQSQAKKELGQLHLEVLQCFGLPTTSLVREVSAYAVAVHGSAAFQTDVIPSVANPMWLSRMRRACLFPVQTMYSQLCIGIFDLEAALADPDTVIGHPGHPGWVPPDQRNSIFGRRGSAGSAGGGHWGIINGKYAPSNPNGGDDDEEEVNGGPQPAAYCTKAEDFIGHVVIDLCRLRPGSTYDVTLPLRRSKHVFTREPQGSVRVRLHLAWNSERSAVTSYLPTKLGGTVHLTKQPNTRYTVNCVDDRAARNVAHAVHGIHMPGKFDLTLVKSTIRELNWTRIHVLRYCRKKELYHLTYWVYPSISGFVFLAWMHAVYFNTLHYIPGHIVIFLLLHLIKNYAYYAMDSPLQNGFLAPTLEELYWALIRGTKKRKKPCIEPLTVERESDSTAITASQLPKDPNNSNQHPLTMSGGGGNNGMMDELYDENGNLVHVSRFPLSEIAEAMRKSLKVQSHRRGFTVFKYSFQGDDAVDFLVSKGFVVTRPEAVSLGRRLEREKHLFQHINKDVLFEDAPFIYHFMENDSQRYVIKESHVPKGGRLLELLGFYSRGGGGGVRSDKEIERGDKKFVGGVDILESREHVEFPFATGVDHPRFTVKESLVIRSTEEKAQLGKEEQAKAMAEVAEFGIVPTAGTAAFGADNNNNHNHNHAATNVNVVSGYESERDTKMTGNARGSRRFGGNNTITSDPRSVPGGVGNKVGRTVRRGSLIVGTAVSNVTTTVAAGANAVTETLTASIRGVDRGNSKMMNSAGTMLEVATGEEMYNKLREQNNAELDRVLELQRQADEYDPYQYDSDTDVGDVHKKKRKKYVIIEKHLKKPMNQEIDKIGATAVDMSLAKALQKARRQVNAIFYHMFDDQVYKIDKNLFPTKLDKKTDKEIKTKKKRGLFNRRISNEKLKEEEQRHKKLQMTPYERRQEEMDQVLMINQYSHHNPWINRVAIVMQPLLEMSQTFLFAFRATFNVFTWQDPVLCFWLCFLGPFVAFVLYVAPYRILSFFLGIYVIGPQNYVLRVYRETRPGYEPPDFDFIVKKKKIEKVEDFQEMQFFSSEAPGNQQIRFRNIAPAQVKQIVVPSNVLMYNRFYDWPPEPEYARVYASPAPKNLSIPGFADDNDDGYGSESDTSAYIFDQAARNNPEVKKKKKKKKGFRKVTSKLKKGSRASFEFVENAGGAVFTGTEQVFGATTGATVDAMKGTAYMTKNVVKGTGKQAKSAAKGTGNFLRLRRRKKSPKYSEDDDEYY